MSTDVTVIDDRGSVIASSCDESNGDVHSSDGRDRDEYVRISLRLDSRVRGAIVARRAGKHVDSANLAEVLFDMLIDQFVRTREVPSAPEAKDRFIHRLLGEVIDDEETILREAADSRHTATVARLIMHAVTLPPESVMQEVIVTPLTETSWP